MKKWILKAIIQKLISLLPWRHRVNYLFQKYVTRGVRLSDEYFEDRCGHFQQHLTFYRKYKGSPADIRVLELGAGWYPVVPVGFFLAGAGQIYTVDISPLSDKTKVIATVERYLRQGFDPAFQRKDRWTELEHLGKRIRELTWEEILAALRITYLVEDARKLPLETAGFDLITSNNTFEHIPGVILQAILTEFRRVIRPGGLMSHFIDMSDHFAHLDPSITIYNFLRFTPRQWRLIDNNIQPLNRIRLTGYRQMYRESGLPITEERNRPGNLELLASVPLAAPFADLPAEEVAVSHGYLVSVVEEVRATPQGWRN